MKITYDLIKSFSPCYNAEDIGIMPDYSATIPEFINEYRSKVKSQEDIMWTLCRYQFMTDRELRLFAVWSARQVQHLMADERSINALDVAEKYANGLATKEELYLAAESAARSAAESARLAAWSARSAAWSARSAAESAAWSAESAARLAAWSAAESAAESAAWSAAESAAWSAESAARLAAWSARSAAESAAWSAQIDYLLDLFKNKGEC